MSLRVVSRHTVDASGCSKPLVTGQGTRSASRTARRVLMPVFSRVLWRWHICPLSPGAKLRGFGLADNGRPEVYEPLGKRCRRASRAVVKVVPRTAGQGCGNALERHGVWDSEAVTLQGGLLGRHSAVEFRGNRNGSIIGFTIGGKLKDSKPMPE